MPKRRPLLRFLPIVLSLCVVLASSALHAALLLGAGENLAEATGRESTGQRINIDDYHTQYLAAGTYTIEDFAFLAKVQNGGTTSGGSVVPFIAVFDGTQYRLIWRGTQTDLPTTLTNNESAVVHGSTAGSFTLTSDTLVYSGFYTIGEAAVAYRQGYPDNRTDHFNNTGQSVSWSNAIGNNIPVASYTQLTRSYAHGISVQDTTDVRIGPGLTVFTNADNVGSERLNIDRSKPLTLGAGTHTVSSFSYFSTLASGGSLGGSVTPFLATEVSPNQWKIVWLGNAVDNEILGGNEASLNETFTLNEETTLHAGFFTSGGARVAYAQINSGEPGTAHHSAASFTLTEGGTISLTSFPNLNRFYSFEILVSAVPEPGRGLLVMFSFSLLTLVRRRSSLC